MEQTSVSRTSEPVARKLCWVIAVLEKTVTKVVENYASYRDYYSWLLIFKYLQKIQGCKISLNEIILLLIKSLGISLQLRSFDTHLKQTVKQKLQPDMFWIFMSKPFLKTLVLTHFCRTHELTQLVVYTGVTHLHCLRKYSIN